MQLFTPEVGWVLTDRGRFFWTTNAGAQGRAITPSASSDGTDVGVSFLDISNGWILLSGPEEANGEPRESQRERVITGLRPNDFSSLGKSEIPKGGIR
jgi:hypothetical protein